MVDAPPHAVESERVIVSAMVLLGESCTLAPDAFYDRGCRAAYVAAKAIVGRGLVADLPTLAQELEATHKLGEVGGTEGLVLMVDATPATLNLEQHVEMVRQAHVRRRAGLNGKALAGLAGEPSVPIEVTLAEHAEVVEQLREQVAPTRTDLALADLEGVAVSPAWVLRGLHVGPGRPTLLAGYSYSLKSLLGLTMALSSASGEPLWGRYYPRRVRTLVLDYEGGDTPMRLRRLGSAMGLDVAKLARDGWLAVSEAPGRYLDDHNAEAWLTAACEGYGLCLVDSLRQAAPRAEENSSEIGLTLAVPTRVSLATGCSFVLVAHSGKTPKDQSKDDRQTATRGSSAIYSQAGCVLHVDRAGEDRPGVHCIRQRKRPTGAWGPPVEPLDVRITDDEEHQVPAVDLVAGDDGTLSRVSTHVPGLCLELCERQPGGGPLADTLEDKVLAELGRRSPQSRGDLARTLSRRKSDVSASVTQLLRSGRLVETDAGLTLQSHPKDPDPWSDGFQEELL